ncbi:SDR family NAD(P)-dependent oxidoreductase [Luteimicrobium subarcticum]|uniref:NAD(P)-dependent dehydrogenase (Short-subunit alcohol dehydrogenase family) n=1 Tax=Luteimicrobium subarcticum TaxID=620910 RepID=A0A2M8WR31_9MICO|nr:SDR family oxidoreductase [Luteimicrobium subarcticum]PJI93392.1 NAD(P)-dependent dehydrogenase (short-subunit alcohol dehydrogenase family) [Luteimicrobium subarcticum]
MAADASTRPVTIVTGASRGIGEAIAVRLAAAGHDLVLTYRVRHDEALDVRRRCEASGGRVLLLQIDMDDLDAAATLVPTAVAAFGTVTGLVNNAGITPRIGPFLDAPVDETERLFRVNVLAPTLITQAAIAHMSTALGGAGGSIVNISSGAATSGSPHTYVTYAMSKAALHALTIGASKEFAAEGVRVNTVSPGTTRTEIHAAGGRPDAPEERAPNIPMRRAGEVHEIAGAVLYLLSDDASYTTGADIRITGGS